MLFRSGFGFADLHQVIDSISSKPLEVVCSHGHYDHIGGADQFEEVWLHDKDLELAKLHSNQKFRQRAVSKGKEVERRPFSKVFPDSFNEEAFLN